MNTLDKLVPRILLSYHYHANPRIIRTLAAAGVRIMIDSGAFSAHTTGVTIDVERYIDFLHEVQDVVDCYFTLDVIGSRDGTLANTRRIKDAGLSPIHIWQGYDWKWSGWDDHFADEPYVALGGIVALSRLKTSSHFKERFVNGFINRVGPHQKSHLLGYTPKHWRQLDVDSLDASTWIAPSRYGADFSIANQHGKEIRFVYKEVKDGQFTVHQRKVIHHWFGPVPIRGLRDNVDWYGRKPQIQRLLMALGFLTKHGFTDRPKVYAAASGLDGPLFPMTLLRMGFFRGDHEQEIRNLVRDKAIFQFSGSASASTP
jgi:hypothetical protein